MTFQQNVNRSSQGWSISLNFPASLNCWGYLNYPNIGTTVFYCLLFLQSLSYFLISKLVFSILCVNWNGIRCVNSESSPLRPSSPWEHRDLATPPPLLVCNVWSSCLIMAPSSHEYVSRGSTLLRSHDRKSNDRILLQPYLCVCACFHGVVWSEADLGAGVWFWLAFQGALKGR